MKADRNRLFSYARSGRMALAAALLLSFVATAMPQARPTPATTSIRESALRAHIKFLSDDLLEGRGTGARGGELAARYIAAQLEALGLRGAGANGSFFQPVSLVGVKADPAMRLTLRGQRGEESFTFAEEFVAFTGAQRPEVNVNAELVFVGYGIEAPEQRWNDYKGSAEDYRGKILVMLVNDPPAPAAEPNLFGGRALTYYGRWTYKLEEAARRGAAGAILLHTDESAGYPWSVVRTSWGTWRYEIARGEGDRTPHLDIAGWMTNDAAQRMMRAAGQDLDALRRQAATREFRPAHLNLTASLALRSEMQRSAAPNVAAILPGRDPRLRDEYVIYTAHWDHLGVGAPDAQGDTINNGAADNASGVAAVLTIAEAFARLPENERPRRSILFLLTTAEEQGLLGAEWYVRNPLVPLARAAANINLDALNIYGATRDFVPLGAERSTLRPVVEAVAREREMTIAPDPRPEQGIFFRSDHFPFAKAGVPAISMGTGRDFVGRTREWAEEQFRLYNTQRYHQPSDEYDDSWDLRGMMQQADIAFAIGRRVADADEMPRYNPDDEFGRVRR